MVSLKDNERNFKIKLLFNPYKSIIITNKLTFAYQRYNSVIKSWDVKRVKKEVQSLISSY
jgi:hypothetical protein